MRSIALSIVLGILLVYTGLVLAQENNTGNQTDNITLSCDSNNLNLCYTQSVEWLQSGSRSETFLTSIIF